MPYITKKIKCSSKALRARMLHALLFQLYNERLAWLYYNEYRLDVIYCLCHAIYKYIPFDKLIVLF